MIRKITYVILLVAAGILIHDNAVAQDGYQIMLKSHNVYEGDDSKCTMNMVLMNKIGKKRIREVLFWALERGDEDKSLMYFEKPPGDKGTAFLTWEHKDDDDDQWLYLPALKRVKRISAADKHKSFMGTDFSYNDLSPPHPDEFHHTLKGSESFEGHDCYIVESIHKSYTGDADFSKKKKYQYSKQVSWIRKDNFLLVKAVMFDKKEKRFKEFYAADIRQVQGIWTAMDIRMKNLGTDHQTILTIRKIHYNIGLTDDFFTTRELERTR